MKTLFLLLCVMMLLSQCSLRKENHNVIIHVNVLNKVNPDEFKGQKGVFYSIDIELTNNSDTTIRYWTSSCSWQNNWISNSDSILVFGQGCPKNIPRFDEIKPKGKGFWSGYIGVKGSIIEFKGKEIKLGLCLLDRNELIKSLSEEGFLKILFERPEREKDIIWSESFKINK